ncbi:MAG: hypothetical protein ASARMPREDX12_006159 [Alectoria sarmentosa]|nr:MAG: hypothetical protein ASARMPREDX12_006159 [Alectoria sarmentosa]
MPPLTVITPALLSSVREQPHLPRHAWYFLTGATLSVLNMPHEIPTVFKHAIEKGAGSCDTKPGHEEQLEIARKMREALVKAAPIGGLPKAINALFLLKSATPPSLLDEPLGYSPTARPSDLYDVPQSTVLHRGQSFFDKVYGKVSKRVMSQMDRSGTEDLGITARLMYGYILSNTNVLSARETSFVLVAGLIPQDVPAQLKGHIKGCLNHGASVEEVKAVREVVIKICEASGMRQLDGTIPGGWGWRGPVANL